MSKLNKNVNYESFCFDRNSKYKILFSCGFLEFCHGWNSLWIADEIIAQLDSLYFLGLPFTVYILKENEKDYQILFKNKLGKVMLFKRVPDPDSEFELDKNLQLLLKFCEKLQCWILMFPGENHKE